MLIPTFYMPQMSAEIQSFSHSARKPAEVINSWIQTNAPIELREFEPVTTDMLKRVHDPEYVDGILSCRLKNGFGNRSVDVAESLPYTSGSMLAAAREALANKRVAMAPCAGFHHAGYSDPFGYCTFNGLVVTAFTLADEKQVSHVGILDLDMHNGDGTEALIQHHQAQDWIVHVSTCEEYTRPEQADEFLGNIEGWMSAFRDCDLLLYQASADSHVDDPLGGYLTTEQIKLRDKMVFSIAKEMKMPIAWNLAGGYQIDETGSIGKVIEIHANTLRICAEVYHDE